MASWLFGISKQSADQIVEAKDTPPVPTMVNPEPVKTLPTMPKLLYDLQPAKPTILPDLKPTSMLDSIPFVLSSHIITTTKNHSYTLENTKKQLLSIKKKLESDEYNYDFSNDKRLHSKLKSNIPKDNVFPVLLNYGDNKCFHCICLNIFH